MVVSPQQQDRSANPAQTAARRRPVVPNQRAPAPKKAASVRSGLLRATQAHFQVEWAQPVQVRAVGAVSLVPLPLRATRVQLPLGSMGLVFEVVVPSPEHPLATLGHRLQERVYLAVQVMVVQGFPETEHPEATLVHHPPVQMAALRRVAVFPPFP